MSETINMKEILIVLVSGVILFQIFCAYKVFQYKRHGQEEKLNKLNAVSKLTQLVALAAVFCLFFFWR